jgi:hypothetical protein
MIEKTRWAFWIKFLEKLPETFDLTNLLDPDVEAIENKIYEKSAIYKYFPSSRRTFFTKPQVRFSPRQALNDPFEMSRRWREISTEGLRDYVKDKLNASLPAAFSNKDLLVSILGEGLLEKGHVLTPEQKQHAEDILESEHGRLFLKNQLIVAQQALLPVVDIIFSQLEATFDQVVNNVVSSSGVLCLSEDALSQQMWAHYADQGKGFVVGFNARHPFFSHRDGSTQRNLLKKVIYTDEHTQNFWRNPYYLFLVKAPGWAYEKEWRMFKKFGDSDEVVVTATPQVHLWNLAPAMISTCARYPPVERTLAARRASHRWQAQQIQRDVSDASSWALPPVRFSLVVTALPRSLHPIVCRCDCFLCRVRDNSDRPSDTHNLICPHCERTGKDFVLCAVPIATPNSGIERC